MTDVGDWLTSIGLGQYAEIFRENEIDREILGELTDRDFRELNIPLGHRKKLLKAIAELPAAATAPQPAHGQPAANPAVAAAAAERRQLTVMFVDLQGSTLLSNQLDLESLRELILRYQNAVAGEITRYEGFIARYMGDGVLAYFGWPRVHEDEAERAVRAALAVTAAVAKLLAPDGTALATRIGIATGLVVIGDLIGQSGAQEQSVVGETPNLAARLQELAEPGTVVISERTRRLLGELFRLDALGAHQFKDIAPAVNVYRVSGERIVESRFQAQRANLALPMVGRDHELAQLMTHWQQAQAGNGRIVLLSGEAGIGKSRIQQALNDALSGQPHYRMHYQCSPYHSDSSLYPVLQQLVRAADFSAGDDDAIRLDKLEALLGLALTEPRQSAALIAALLGIDGEARYGKTGLSAQQQRKQTLQTLLAQLVGLAQRQPVLVIIEDAHWIDPTTLELIEMSLAVLARTRALLLITARPPFEQPFTGHPLVTQLVLNRLDRESSLSIIRRLSDDKTLPDELLEEIINKTDGVPLFIEELTKTVLESGLLRLTDSAYVLQGSLRSIDVPSSLHDSLMARLDRLQPVREVAQTAACIGREFSYALLAAVVALDAEQLQATLTQLIESKLIFRHGPAATTVYAFKHALVRDATYESLLKSKRQVIHARIAQILEERFAQIAAGEPELIAYHYTEAQLAGPALDYWEQAGERAVKRSANREAIAHLRQGLNILQTLPDSDTRRQRELRLQTLLAGPLIATKGYGAAETVQVFERAHALSKQGEDISLLFPMLYGQFVYKIVWAEHPTARRLAEEFLDLARQQQETGLILVGHRILANSMYCQGNLIDARGHLEQTLALYRPERHAELAFRFGQNPNVAALTQISGMLHILGYPDQGAHMLETAIDDARACNHIQSLAYALYFSGILLGHWRREPARVERHSGELLKLAETHGLAMWRAFAVVSQGWVQAQKGQYAAGLAETRRGFDDLQATGTRLNLTFTLSLLAEIHAGCDQWREGLDLLEQALVQVGRSDERWYEAELHRLKGVLLLAGDDPSAIPAAENCFHDALAIARRQSAKAWELRAVLSLARLWRRQNKSHEAYELLRPVYDGFREGFDTADGKDARALLDQLR